MTGRTLNKIAGLPVLFIFAQALVLAACIMCALAWARVKKWLDERGGW